MRRSTVFGQSEHSGKQLPSISTRVRRSHCAKAAWCLKRIDPFIGDLYLENVHMGTMRPYIEHGQKKGWKNRTINMPMEVVRRILNLAAGEWLDENGLTWLQSAPKIRLLPRDDATGTLSPVLGGAERRLFSSSHASSPDVPLCSEHGTPESGSLWSAMGR